MAREAAFPDPPAKLRITCGADRRNDRWHGIPSPEAERALGDNGVKKLINTNLVAAINLTWQRTVSTGIEGNERLHRQRSPVT